MDHWNGLDFFVFLILTLNTIRGISRGAGKELIALMCLSAALIFAIQFTVPLTHFLSKSPILVSVVDNSFVENFIHAIGAGPLTLSLLNNLMYSLSLLICFVSVFSVTEACIFYSGYMESLTMTQAIAYRKIGGAIGFTRGYIISLIFLSILVLHIYPSGNGLPGKRLISQSFFVNLFHSQIIRLDKMIGSQEVERYHELYKDKPYTEKDLIQKLTPQKSEESFTDFFY